MSTYHLEVQPKGRINIIKSKYVKGKPSFNFPKSKSLDFSPDFFTPRPKKGKKTSKKGPKKDFTVGN